jgi:hypothetical protein
VFGHVVFERNLVRHNLTADAVGRVAQVDLIVLFAVFSRAVRFLAHAAFESPINLVNPSTRPSLDGLGERQISSDVLMSSTYLSCKFG